LRRLSKMIKMSFEKELQNRSESKCELCESTDGLSVYAVQPTRNDNADDHAYLCANCIEQIENPDKINPNHWRCLNASMWSPIPAVQVLSWRMLHQLKGEGWTDELLEMLFLDDETLEWAQALSGSGVKHVDANGVVLEAGDTVVLTQDLKVKGANFTAKRGTAVRRISLVADNPEHIEGKIDGQRIVILTKFVKKK